MNLVALACGQPDSLPGDVQPMAVGADRPVVEWNPPSAEAQAADLVPREPCAHNDPLRIAAALALAQPFDLVGE